MPPACFVQIYKRHPSQSERALYLLYFISIVIVIIIATIIIVIFIIIIIIIIIINIIYLHELTYIINPHFKSFLLQPVLVHISGDKLLLLGSNKKYTFLKGVLQWPKSLFGN